MRSSTILSMVGVGAIALVLGVAIGSVAFPTIGTSTQVFTKTATQSTTLYYGVQTVTMPVPCCASIPENFVVGNYLFDVTEYAPMPPVTRNGTETVFSGGVLMMFNVTLAHENGVKQIYEQANFTWAGTFSETIPYPSNATLFGGQVRLAWFVNNSMLYLVVATGSSTTTLPENSDKMVCVSAHYYVIGRETITVENGTTYTTGFTVITSSSETTFTTTSQSQTIGYATATTSYSPPSSWTVVSCTYVSG